MAKYKKKRARELQHDRFRDTTIGFFDRLGNLLEGRGRTILYSLAGLILASVLVVAFVKWSNKKSNEAEQALGRAITISKGSVLAAPVAGSTEPSFASEQERAQTAIAEFEKVAAKYGDPYKAESRYFIATNRLVLDRPKGISELEELAKSSVAEVATLSKFALAQAKESDGKFDEAAEHLRVALSAGSSNDGEAQYLLAKSLKATGPHDEAQQADDEARRLLDNRYAKWEIAPEQMPILARMKTDFSRAAYYKLERQQQRTAALPSTQLILQQQVFDRARRLASEGKDVEALAELQRLLDANGSMSEAHLLKAQLHQRRNETDQAISSYLLAIDRNPRLVAAHVALGQIYFARGDRARAIAHSKQAIEIDPRDREAVALWSQIGTGR